MKINRKIIIIISIALILISGFSLRYFAVIDTSVDAPIRVDAKDYYFYAQNLKEFGIYSKQDRSTESLRSNIIPDAHRNPGYSLFLLPLIAYPPTLEMLQRVYIVQAIISTITIIFSLLFFKSFLPWPYTLGGALLVALSPHLISMNTFILSEGLFIFFLLLTGLSISNYGNQKSFISAAMVGLVLGLALLVRPTVIYFPLFMLMLLPHINAKKILTTIIAFTIGFYLVYGPWVIRNKISVPLSNEASLMTATLQKGMYPGLMYNNDPKTFGYPNYADPEWESRKTLTSVLSEIKRRFVEKPFEHIHWYLIGKPITFLSWSNITGVGDVFIYPIIKSPYFENILFHWTHAIMYWLHWPLITLCLFASIIIWLPIYSKKVTATALLPIRYCSLLLLYFILVHVAGTPLPRYSIPIFPYVYAMSMVGLSIIVSEALAYYRKKFRASIGVSSS